MFLSVVEKSEKKGQHFVSFPAKVDEKARDPRADLIQSGTHEALTGSISTIANVVSLGLLGAPVFQASGKIHQLSHWSVKNTGDKYIPLFNKFAYSEH